MTTRNLTTRLRTAYADLHHILGIDNDQSCRSPLDTANRNLSTWAAKGHQQTSLTGTRSPTPTDLSTRIALALDAGRSPSTDEFAAQHRQLVKTALILIDTAAALRRLVDAATNTVDPTTAARTSSLDECRLCAVVGSHSAVYARGLCDWCWRLSQRLGRDTDGQWIDPHTELVRRHNQGLRVTETLIDTYHPTGDA